MKFLVTCIIFFLPSFIFGQWVFPFPLNPTQDLGHAHSEILSNLVAAIRERSNFIGMSLFTSNTTYNYYVNTSDPSSFKTNFYYKYCGNHGHRPAHALAKYHVLPETVPYDLFALYNAYRSDDYLKLKKGIDSSIIEEQYTMEYEPGPTVSIITNGYALYYIPTLKNDTPVKHSKYKNNKIYPKYGYVVEGYAGDVIYDHPSKLWMKRNTYTGLGNPIPPTLNNPNFITKVPCLYTNVTNTVVTFMTPDKQPFQRTNKTYTIYWGFKYITNSIAWNQWVKWTNECEYIYEDYPTDMSDLYAWGNSIRSWILDMLPRFINTSTLSSPDPVPDLVTMLNNNTNKFKMFKGNLASLYEASPEKAVLKIDDKYFWSNKVYTNYKIPWGRVYLLPTEVTNFITLGVTNLFWYYSKNNKLVVDTSYTNRAYANLSSPKFYGYSVDLNNYNRMCLENKQFVRIYPVKQHLQLANFIEEIRFIGLSLNNKTWSSWYDTFYTNPYLDNTFSSVYFGTFAPYSARLPLHYNVMGLFIPRATQQAGLWQHLWGPASYNGSDYIKHVYLSGNVQTYIQINNKFKDKEALAKDFIFSSDNLVFHISNNNVIVDQTLTKNDLLNPGQYHFIDYTAYEQQSLTFSEVWGYKTNYFYPYYTAELRDGKPQLIPRQYKYTGTGNNKASFGTYIDITAQVDKVYCDSVLTPESYNGIYYAIKELRYKPYTPTKSILINSIYALKFCSPTGSYVETRVDALGDWGTSTNYTKYLNNLKLQTNFTLKPLLRNTTTNSAGNTLLTVSLQMRSFYYNYLDELQYLWGFRTTEPVFVVKDIVPGDTWWSYPNEYIMILNNKDIGWWPPSSELATYFIANAGSKYEINRTDGVRWYRTIENVYAPQQTFAFGPGYAGLTNVNIGVYPATYKIAEFGYGFMSNITYYVYTFHKWGYRESSPISVDIPTSFSSTNETCDALYYRYQGEEDNRLWNTIRPRLKLADYTSKTIVTHPAITWLPINTWDYISSYSFMFTTNFPFEVTSPHYYVYTTSGWTTNLLDVSKFTNNRDLPEFWEWNEYSIYDPITNITGEEDLGGDCTGTYDITIGGKDSSAFTPKYYFDLDGSLQAVITADFRFD